MTPEQFLNMHFYFLLQIINDLLADGKPIPQKLIDDAIETGRKAGFPEEEINTIRMMNDDGATIH